ncbi:MAG TPA: hypothetical protein VFS21_29180 [Roseiflexaceae bacterium]|nr:hypothetical protein [Roseiflexaceae bacterium]
MPHATRSRRTSDDQERGPAFARTDQSDSSPASPVLAAPAVLGHTFANITLFNEAPAHEPAVQRQIDPGAPAYEMPAFPRVGHALGNFSVFAPAPSAVVMRKAADEPAAAVAAPEPDALLQGMPEVEAVREQIAADSTPSEEGDVATALAPFTAGISGGTGQAPNEATEQALAEVNSTGEAAQQPAAQSAAGVADPDYAWRVAQDPDMEPLIEAILGRLAQFNDLTLRGFTPEQAIRRFILGNRGISNEQMRAMTLVVVDNPENDDADIDDSQADKDETYRKFPDVRSSMVHRFTVALFAGITGAPFEQISEAAPTLGVTGVARRQLGLVQVFWLSDSPYVQLSTALHDFTDTMRGVGVEGINKAVWGSEGQVSSALVSFLWAQGQKVSDLLDRVGEAVTRVKDAVVDRVQGWVDQARGWFGRFRRWLGGGRTSQSSAGGD